MMIIIDNI